MPAILFAVLYIGVSVYGMKKNLGNIGYEAHIGGAVGGVIYTIIFYEGAIKMFLSNF